MYHKIHTYMLLSSEKMSTRVTNVHNDTRFIYLESRLDELLESDDFGPARVVLAHECFGG